MATADMAMIHEYTGYTFAELDDMDFIEFLALRRDAFVRSLERTEAGSKYLAEAWQREQTEPDRATLRSLFGRGR